MQDRREALSAFKEGYVRFLIATDVAARGIDVSGLPYVRLSAAVLFIPSYNPNGILNAAKPSQTLLLLAVCQ